MIEFSDWQVPLTLVFCGLSLIIILTNGLVTFAILCGRNKNRLRTPTNLLVANLACTDLLVGLMTIPACVVSIFNLHANMIACFLLQWLTFIPVKVSVFGYLALSAERYLAVCRPYRYIKLCTTRNALWVIVVTWLAGILFSCIVFYHIPELVKAEVVACRLPNVIPLDFMTYGNFLACILPCGILVTAFYACIIKEAKRLVHSRRVIQRTVSVIEACGRAEFQTSVRCCIPIAIFFICQMPIHLISCVNLWAGKACLPCIITFIIIMFANSMINPILYSLTNQQLKLEVIMLLSYLRHCGSQPLVKFRSQRRRSKTTKTQLPRLSDLKGLHELVLLATVEMLNPTLESSGN